MGLSGRNDVTTTTQQYVVPEGQEGWGQPVFQKVKGGLLEMLDWPEEEWINQKVLGKELPQPGIGGKTLDFAAIRRGLSGWSKGPIPNVGISLLMDLLSHPTKKAVMSILHLKNLFVDISLL